MNLKEVPTENNLFNNKSNILHSTADWPRSKVRLRVHPNMSKFGMLVHLGPKNRD